MLSGLGISLIFNFLGHLKLNEHTCTLDTVWIMFGVMALYIDQHLDRNYENIKKY